MVNRAYLQWIGTGNFASIADFVKAVPSDGVCRKLPNRPVAIEVAKPGTIVLLVHDQGRLQECLACSEMQTCPECGGSGGGDPVCQRCKGLGSLERGTGGDAMVDGERWPYVRYIKLKRNRGHEFWQSEHEIEDVEFCAVCGGRGRLPLGAIFGLYAPESVSYVLRPTDPTALAQTLSDASIRVHKHQDVSNRGWTAGSFYAVTAAAPRDTPPVDEMLLEVAQILDKRLLYYGNFAHLPEPMAYKGKHFRGLKRWQLIPMGAPTPPALMEGVA